MTSKSKQVKKIDWRKIINSVYFELFFGVVVCSLLFKHYYKDAPSTPADFINPAYIIWFIATLYFFLKYNLLIGLIFLFLSNTFISSIRYAAEKQTIITDAPLPIYTPSSSSPSSLPLILYDTPYVIRSIEGGVLSLSKNRFWSYRSDCSKDSLVLLPNIRDGNSYLFKFKRYPIQQASTATTPVTDNIVQSNDKVLIYTGSKLCPSLFVQNDGSLSANTENALVFTLTSDENVQLQMETKINLLSKLLNDLIVITNSRDCLNSSGQPCV